MTGQIGLLSVAELSDLLAHLLKGRGAKPKSSQHEWFGPETRVLDERDVEEAKKLIVWSQNHDFWQNIILNMKLFERHYDKMLFQARKSVKPEICVAPDPYEGFYGELPGLSKGQVQQAVYRCQKANYDLTKENLASVAGSSNNMGADAPSKKRGKQHEEN